MTSVIVVGASVAGLLAARALADHVDDVVVVERERLDDAAVPRGHVPQGRHLHLLLSAGLDLLVGWFPGIDDELESLGAVRVDGTRAWVHQSGGYRARGDWGRPVLSLTRPLLEQVVRRRVAALGTVTLRDGVVVERVESASRAGDRCRGRRRGAPRATWSSTARAGPHGSPTSWSRAASSRRRSPACRSTAPT